MKTETHNRKQKENTNHKQKAKPPERQAHVHAANHWYFRMPHVKTLSLLILLAFCYQLHIFFAQCNH